MMCNTHGAVIQKFHATVKTYFRGPLKAARKATSFGPQMDEPLAKKQFICEISIQIIKNLLWAKKQLINTIADSCHFLYIIYYQKQYLIPQHALESASKPWNIWKPKLEAI